MLILLFFIYSLNVFNVCDLYIHQKPSKSRGPSLCDLCHRPLGWFCILGWLRLPSNLSLTLTFITVVEKGYKGMTVKDVMLSSALGR